MNGTNLTVYNASKTLALKLHLGSNSPSNAKTPQVKDNRMLGFINRNFSFENKDVILSLHIILVRPHLEYAVQFWAPHHAMAIEKLETVQ